MRAVPFRQCNSYRGNRSFKPFGVSAASYWVQCLQFLKPLLQERDRSMPLHILMVRLGDERVRFAN